MSGDVLAYGRVLTVSIAPEHIANALKLFTDTTVPIVTGQPGLITLLFMANHARARSLTATIWDTPESHASSEVSPAFMQDLALYGTYFTGAVTRANFDVTIDTLRRGGDQPRDLGYARVTQEAVRRERWDEAVASLREMVVRDISERPGSLGVLLLESPNAGRVMLIELWETREAIEVSAESVYVEDQRARRRGYVSGAPTHETFQVITRYTAGG